MNEEFERQRGTDSLLVNQFTSIPPLTERDLRDNPELADGRLFPCRSNEDVRTALLSMLKPQSEIEVAGGIVRHDFW